MSTVQRYIRKYNEGGMENLTDGRSGNGARRKTTPEQDLAIVAEATQNNFDPATSVGPAVALPAASPWIVRNRLNAVGLKSRVASKKGALTEEHKAARIAFARECLPMTEEEWGTVIYTDETVVSSDKDGRYRVWRLDGERYNPRNVIANFHSGRVTVAAWGWMSGFGPGALFRIERRMTAVDYIDILEDIMLPSVRAVFPEAEMPIIRIVEDNSAVHRARIVRDWYAQHPEVQRFNWPARSPDLNPIENCWAEVVRGWRPVPRERQDGLWHRVSAKWEDLRMRPEYTEALTRSMPRRMQAVLDAQGAWIKY